MHITVYGKDNCPPCSATIRRLDRIGASYDYINMSTDREALSWVLSQGFTQSPVIVADNGAKWSGYNPELIDQAFEEQQANLAAA